MFHRFPFLTRPNDNAPSIRKAGSAGPRPVSPIPAVRYPWAETLHRRFTRPPKLIARLDRRLLAGAAGVVVAAAILLVVVLAVVCGGDDVPAPPPTPTPTPSPTATPTPTPAPSEATLIDGVLVYPEAIQRISQRLPLAIILENHVAARPQFGLDRAELVYEAIAEGGITRFLAIYWRNDVDRIEPLRSARVYYIDWTAELDAVFVHHGFAESSTAADVQTQLARTGVRDLDGFFLGDRVGERDPDRPSPHNVMSSTGLLWSTAADRGFSGPPTNLQPWAFKDDAPQRAADPANRAAPAVDISFGGGFTSAYAVRWDYDPAGNGYLRSMGGQPHVDAGSGARIAARNVAVQYTPFTPAGDGVHNLYGTVGEGQAVVFQDGVAVEGTWRKPDVHSRTRYYDAAGNEIPFNRGQTWVEVVPAGYPVQY